MERNELRKRIGSQLERIQIAWGQLVHEHPVICTMQQVDPVLLES